MTDEKERNKNVKNDVWNIIEGQIKKNINFAFKPS